MSFSEELRKIRRKCFLSQADFAKELQVSLSSVNRWEGERTKPNMIAMKSLKKFCESHSIDFSTLEEEWLNRN